MHYKQDDSRKAMYNSFLRGRCFLCSHRREGIQTPETNIEDEYGEISGTTIEGRTHLYVD